MSWVIVGVTVATAAYSAYSSREAGKQQKYDIERQAEVERLSAQDQEIQRRERLNKVLAANVASASTMNGEGSPQSIALESARSASSSEGAESLSERLRQDLLRREAKAAKSAGNTQAASTLLQGASRTAQLKK